MRWNGHFLAVIIIISITVSCGVVFADDENLTIPDNQTAENESVLLSGVEYPEDELLSATDTGSPDSVQGYADVGRISTGFSGSSLEATGEDQNPSAVMTFSDKSSVSGFIKNFMKSFHWESGVDL